MLARILFITDLHKRWHDSESIKGSMQVHPKIQEDIIRFNQDNGVTHNIILGDWYDRGFHGLCQSWGATEMDRRISRSVNGNVYLCIGNHFYLERDENPEMYIIQPNQFLKPQYDIPLPEEPIFKVVPSLVIGSVKIDFFHYSKINKEYVAARDSNVLYHIGVYHDDMTVPSWVSEMDGYVSRSTQTYYNRIYANIDMAIHGHIHSKVGLTKLTLETGREVPMYIPGSLGITQNKDSMKHTGVNLPVLDIYEDGTVKWDTAPFSTYLNELRFVESKKKKKKQLLEEGAIPIGDIHIASTSAGMASLEAFLAKKGYSDLHLRILNEAKNETLTVLRMVHLLQEVRDLDG